MKKTSGFEKFLFLIIGILILVLVSGTIAGISKKKNSAPEVLISLGKAENLTAPKNTDVVAYYNLGAIRIVTAPENTTELGNAMIINPWIAYPEGDSVFYEEIARKRGVIKGLFTVYFTEHTKSQLLTAGEKQIDQDLIKQINEILALGKISDIYFTDFMFL